jgi:EpsI family protein
MTSNTQRARGFSWPALLCGLAGVAVFQFFGNATRGYIDTASLFHWWGFQWFNRGSETEHGPLILAISAWLLWRNLKGSAGFQPATGDGRQDAGATLAMAAMIAGLALNAVGFIAQQARFGIAGFLIFAWGALALGGGRRWARAAAFPLGFMLFAVPVNVLDTAGFWLRVWVVEASTPLAHAVGIDIVRSGTQLFSPDGRYQYDVAAACSGVRSLVALAALSLLIGYLNFRSWWRRGLMLGLCFPLTYLGNVARIGAIVVAAHWGGQVWGERAHDVMGYGVFVIVLGGVLGAAELLRRWWPETCQLLVDDNEGLGETRRAGSDAVAAREKVAPTPQSGGRESCAKADAPARRPYLLAAAVVGLAVGEMFFLAHVGSLSGRGAAGVQLAADGRNPVELPSFLGTEWIGRRAEVTAVEREILPADTGFSRRNYVAVADARHSVFLSIVLSGRDRTSIHRPELCLVGQGWTIAGTGAHRFTWPGEPGATVPATLLRTVRSDARSNRPIPALMAYWFVNGDTVVATHWERFFHDAWNRLRHGRADRWAYVLVQADAGDGEAAALARMQAVLDATLPVFQRRAVTR